MVPIAEYFTRDDATALIPEDERDATYPDTSGWYARLSAPGYLDCTDWQGPFDRAWKALRDVCETFDVRLDGEDRYPNA